MRKRRKHSYYRKNTYKKKQSKAKPKIPEAAIFPSLQSATTGGISRIDHLIKKTHHRYLPGIMTTTTTTTTTTCRSNHARFITNALIFLTVICGGSIVTHHPGSMRLHVVSAYAYTIIPGSRILTTKTTTRTFLTQQPGQWKNQNKNHVIDITRSRNNNSYKQHRLQRQQQRPTTTTTTTTTSSSSSTSSSTRLYHMGHSHSHHDHGHSSSSTNNNKSKTYNKQERMVRRLAIVLVCWIATCGTKLFQAAKLTQNDWISFVVTSVALTSADNIKKAFERSVDNFRQFVDGIRKHSSSSAASLTDNNQLQQKQQQQQQYHDNVFNGDTSEADRVTWIGVWVNLFLSVGKLAIGITSHSSVLVADAGHSLSDLFSDFITLWSVNVARIPPDDDHPYGHYKFEAIGSLFLSLTLLATGASVGLMANKQLIEVLHATKTVSSTTTAAAAAAAAVQLPGPLALAMAGISIASKEWLFRITKQVGDRLRSPVVIANAWHHRSDAYSSILALLSIAWAMTGFAAADAAAGILVAGMICMTGSEILIESVKQLSDGADLDLQTEVFEILNDMDDDDVIATTSVRARQMGSAASVDVTVEIPSVLSTTATRAVENRVKQRLLVELARRRGGGDDDGNDSTSSSGVIANVYAKPYLDIPLMEDFEKRSLQTTTGMTDDYDETTFAKLAFEKFDTNVDGRLSIEELKWGLEKTLKIELSIDRVQKLMDELDVNKDGYLELEEMVSIDKFSKRIESFSKEEKELAIRQELQQQQQTLLDDMPSTTYIEQQVRNEAKLMYPKIRSVEGVTVHFTSQHSVTVDVNVRITEDDEDSTENNALRKVREYARELKGNLETKLHEIESAQIYLDLNTDNDDGKYLTLNNSTSVSSSSSLAP